MRKRRRLEWFKDRLYGVLDEVIAGLIIAAILGGMSYVGWLATNILPGLFANPALLATVGAVVVVLLAAVATLIWRRRKHFGLRHHPTFEEERDVVLKRLFTGRTGLLETFKRLLDEEYPERRIVNIHGVGGVGKSWLLCMYRLICLEQEILVALVSGDEERSALNVLGSFSRQLEGQGVTLTTFEDALEYYKHILAKVQRKTTEWSALAKVAVEGGKTIPYVGGEIDALGVGGAEQLVGLLRKFLAQEDIDLYLNPEPTLTERFLEDLAEASARKRAVLMLDTYEQMKELDAWVRNWVERLSGNLLVVIAGRAPLSLDWRDLRPMIEVIELKEMATAEARECLKRYHQEYLKRPLGATAVERLVQFGRGLPLALSSAVYLMAQYGVEEFAAHQREIIADLVEVMTREAGKGWRPVLEACAIVRWFTEDTLRAMLGPEDVVSLYDELRHFPFVRPRPEGLALHDRVRDFLSEDLEQRSPDRYRELHERAAGFYEERLAKTAEDFTETWQRLVLERIYHGLRMDEKETVLWAYGMIKRAYKQGRLDFAEILLNDLDEQPLTEESKRWIQYYRSHLAWCQGKWDKQREIYLTLLSYGDLAPALRRATVEGLARLCRVQGEMAESLELFSGQLEALKAAGDEVGLGRHLDDLGTICRWQSRWLEAVEYFEDALQYAQAGGDKGRQCLTLLGLSSTSRLRGLWKEADEYLGRSLELAEQLEDKNLLGIALRYSAHLEMLCGRWDEATEQLKQSEKLHKEAVDPYLRSRSLLLLASIYGKQGRCREAYQCYEKADIILRDLGQPAHASADYAAQFGAFLGTQREWEKAKKHLNSGMAWAESIGDQNEKANLLYLEAEVLLGQEEYEKGYPLYHRSWEMAKDIDSEFYRARAALGLCRCQYARRVLDTLVGWEHEVEHPALEYGYWAQLAWLRVLQGHMAWEGLLIDSEPGSHISMAATSRYQEAMTYALRYNRYLLDEVLEQIIAKCKEFGEEGWAMLERLAEFWRTGKAEEGVALVEAECAGREREKGDGKPQVMVLERLLEEIESQIDQ